MLKPTMAAFAALSLAAAPVANAAPARASAPMEQGNALAGGEGGGLILAIVIVAGIIGAILAQEDDNPDSP